MAGFLTRALDIREGEGPLVIRSTITLFGLIGAHTLLETARDALFLAKLPASRLPLVYALLAGVALLVARWNTGFVRRFGRRNSLVFTLLGSAYGTVVLYLLPPNDGVVFALYVWSALLGTILVTQFWMLAGQSFTVAQGKRLFGPITAGGVLGAVVGASAAVAALRFVPVHRLILVSAVLFLATSLLLTMQESDEVLPEVPAGASEPAATGLWQHIRSQPYLGRLVVLVALSTAAVLGADYLFKSAVAKSMRPDEIGPFIASAYTIMNAVALVVQLVLAGYLVRRGGVIAAYCVLPVLLLMGGSATLLTGGAVLATMLVKGADGALRHSLHRIASELLWMPLSDDTRAVAKPIVDTVIVRGTQALFAGLLFSLAMLGADGPITLGLLLIGMAALWLVVAIGLRRPYLDLFKSALHRQSARDRSSTLRLDLESIEVVVEALSDREPMRSLAAVELLANGGRTRLIPALILYHEADEVVIRSLEVIGVPGRQDWVPHAKRLLLHQSNAVRVAAVRALARIGGDQDVESRLYDVSPAVRSHAAFWIAERSGQSPASHPAVSQILAIEGEAGRVAHVALLEAIASSGHAGWADVVMTLCKSEDPAVVDAAVRAVGLAGDARFIDLLISRLRFRQGRSAVRDAIVALGDPALAALELALDDSNTDKLVRRHLPRTISRFRSQRAADVLLTLIERSGDGHVRYKALRGLGRLAAEMPVRVERKRIELQVRGNLVEYLRFFAIHEQLRPGVEQGPKKAAPAGGLLLGLVADKREQSLDRAFRLLQIAHRKEDVRSTAFALQSSDKKLRAQALEYLDALTLYSAVQEIRDLVRIIADDLSPSDRIARSASLVNAPRGFDETLSALLKDKDEALVGLVAHFVLEYGLDELRLDVSTITQDGVKIPSLESLVRRFEAGRGIASVA